MNWLPDAQGSGEKEKPCHIHLPMAIIFKSFHSIMHGYVSIPDHMLEDLDMVARYLDESYDYVTSLAPK
jgi:hypothetical protein